MQFAAKLREAMTLFGDELLGGAIETFVEEFEILIERLQFRLGGMPGEFGGEELEAFAELRLP